jgi:hypothetical protein
MSHLSLQDRELKPGDNIFIIHPSSNHNYKKFTVGSYQVGSGRVSGHLVSSHFGCWVGSGFGSSSVKLFRVLGRIRSGRVSGHFEFWVISGRVGSCIGSSSVGSFRVSGRIRSGQVSGRSVSNYFGLSIISD